MKKSLVVAGCLAAFCFFAGNTEANAEELDSVLPVTASISRGAPVRQEALLQSGQKLEISVGSLRSNELVSKYVIKFKVESDTKESFVLEDLFDYGYYLQSASKTFYYTNTVESVYQNLLDEPLKGSPNGKRVFRLYNYSAQPLKVTFAVNSSIHPRDIPCVNYSDIDFTL